YLADFDPPAQFAEVRAFRDPTYPYRAGDWLFGAPPALSIERVQAETVVGGDDARVLVDVAGQGGLGLNCTRIKPAGGEIVTRGQARTVGTVGDAGGPRAACAVELPFHLTATLFPVLYVRCLVA